MKNGKEYCPDEKQGFLSGYSLDSYMQFLTNDYPSILQHLSLFHVTLAMKSPQLRP